MIDTIIFDFGGVLYNIDYYKSINELAKLSSEPDLLLRLSFDEIFNLPEDFEKGLIDEMSFRDFLRNNYKIQADNIQIDTAWNAMLLGLKTEAVDFIKQIKSKYNIALLSNTNSIHYKAFLPEVQDLLDLIQNNYFSHLINMRKPDKEIYEYICSELNLRYENTIFIDDSIANIDGAKGVGLHTFHFTQNYNLSDLLHTI